MCLKSIDKFTVLWYNKSMKRRKDTMEERRGFSINIGFSGLLGIVFIILKLTNVITWSWLWVLAPIWIPFALAILVLVVIGLLYVILYIANGGNLY